MKIVKKGREQKGWSKKFTCTGKGMNGGGCGAVLVVSEEDLYHLYHEWIDGSTDTYSVFSCPCCGVETCVEVPYSVQHLGKRPLKGGKK